MRIAALFRHVLEHPMNRGYRARALERLIRWQFASRLMPNCAFEVPFTQRTVLAMRQGMTGATGNLYCGLHEHREMGFVLHLLRPEDHFADVGANIGSYTVLASGHIGARSTSLEPLPSTFDQLLANLRLNRLDNLVHPLNAGVGSSESRLLFSSGEDTMNHVIAPGEDPGGAVEVEVRTIDDIFGTDIPQCMKIDVEGYETPAIEGAQSVLASPRLRAIIMERGEGKRYGFDESKLHDTMLQAGFEPYAYDPFQRNLQVLRIEDCAAGNVLYLRELDWIQDRVRSAPVVRLPWRDF